MKQLIIKHWISLTLTIFVIVLGGISISQKNRIDDLESDLYYCEDEKDDLENQLEEAEYRIDELESELDECQSELSDCESNKWNLEYELQDAQDELDNQQWNNNW